MKGKQLTLEEVLNLKDGTKVWVEDSDEPKFSGIHKFKKKNLWLVAEDDDFYMLNWIEEDGCNINFYEWIEESDLTADNSVSIIGRNHSDIIKDMATEICNLRGIDLTEDNIDKIMKEFVDKE